MYSYLNLILKFHNILYILKGYTLNHMSSCGTNVLAICSIEFKVYMILNALSSVIMYFYCSAFQNIIRNMGDPISKEEIVNI